MAKVNDEIVQPVRVEIRQVIEGPKLPPIGGMRYIRELQQSAVARAGQLAVQTGQDVNLRVKTPEGASVNVQALSVDSIRKGLEEQRARIAAGGLNPMAFGTQFSAVQRALTDPKNAFTTAPASMAFSKLSQAIEQSLIEQRRVTATTRRKVSEVSRGEQLDVLRHRLASQLEAGGPSPQTAALQAEIAAAEAAGSDPLAFRKATRGARGSLRDISRQQAAARRQRAAEEAATSEELGAISRQAQLDSLRHKLAMSSGVAGVDVSDLAKRLGAAESVAGGTEPEFKESLREARAAARDIDLQQAQANRKAAKDKKEADEKKRLANEAKRKANELRSEQLRALATEHELGGLESRLASAIDVSGLTPETAAGATALQDAAAQALRGNPVETRRALNAGKASLRDISRAQATRRREAGREGRLQQTDAMRALLDDHIATFGYTPAAQAMEASIQGMEAAAGSREDYTFARRTGAASRRDLEAEAEAMAPVELRAFHKARRRGQEIEEEFAQQREFGRAVDRATGDVGMRGPVSYHARLMDIQDLMQQAAPLRGSMLRSDQERLQILDDETLDLIRRNAEEQREVIRAEKANAEAAASQVQGQGQPAFNRAQALNFAYTARNLGGRFSGFMTGLASADPFAYQSTLASNMMSSAAGAGVDVAQYKFLQAPGTSRFAGTKLGGAVLGGALLVKGAIDYVDKMVERGTQVRQQAGQVREGRHLALAQLLASSESQDLLFKDEGITKQGGLIKAADNNVNMLNQFLPPGLSTYTVAYQDALDTQREQMTKMLTTASARYEYGGLVSVDEMIQGAGAISAAGIGARHLAKKAFGGAYVEGVSELGMGAYATALSKSTGLDMGMVTGIMAQRGLGTGTGALSVDANGNISSAVGVVGTAVSRGILSSAAANQFGSAMTGLASQGFNFNYGNEFNFLANMGNAGLTQGHIGNVATGMLQSRSSAFQRISGGFGNIFQDAAMLEALQKSGGDLGRAMDIARSMTTEDQLKAARRTFGDTLTKYGAQSLGLSSGDASKLLGVTGDESLTEGWGVNWDSATISGALKNRLDRSRQEKASDVTDEVYLTEYTERMEDIADTLETVSRTLTKIAQGLPFL